MAVTVAGGHASRAATADEAPPSGQGFGVAVGTGQTLDAAVQQLAVDHPELIPTIRATIEAQETDSSGTGLKVSPGIEATLGQPAPPPTESVVVSPMALGGYTHYEGMLRIDFYWCNPTCEYMAQSTLQAQMDQGYNTLYVQSRVTGSTAIETRQATMKCTRTNGTSCGLTQWIPVPHTMYQAKTLSQSPSTSVNGRWSMTYNATWSGISGVASGYTPYFACTTVGSSYCKWQ